MLHDITQIKASRPLTGQVKVIGHRGSAGTHPENTIPSFARAVTDGADILETDVHLSADNQVVICHDPTVERTTDGHGLIAGMTLAELKLLDAGHGFTPDGGKTHPYRGQGITMPTLEELLQSFPDKPINVEIKVDNPILVQKTLDLLAAYGRLHDATVLVAAAKKPLARRVRTLCPEAKTGHSREEVAWFMVLNRLRVPWLFRPKGQAFQVPAHMGKVAVVTPEFVSAAHALGVEVHVWTINDASEMRHYLSMGVDALFTDFPGRMRKLLAEG